MDQSDGQRQGREGQFLPGWALSNRCWSSKDWNFLHASSTRNSPRSTWLPHEKRDWRGQSRFLAGHEQRSFINLGHQRTLQRVCCSLRCACCRLLGATSGSLSGCESYYDDSQVRLLVQKCKQHYYCRMAGGAWKMVGHLLPQPLFAVYAPLVRYDLRRLG